jgi:PhnB protein
MPHEESAMHACCPYLYFDGQADEAMHAYQRALGGELRIVRYADAPADAGGPPPGCEPSSDQRVMHAMLQFDGGMLMASDTPNSTMAEPMRGMSVNLTLASADHARRVFDALAPQAEIRMPFGATFWADGFGVLVDRFGTPWMVGGGLHEF